MTRAEPDTRAPHFVQSFARGLSVIAVFGEAGDALTLSEVARAATMTRATARRFLLTLVDLGYVRFDGRLFRLTPKVLELGHAYLSGLSLPEVAAPHLERLAGHTRESSSVCVLDGPDIVYVARVATSRIMTVDISIGTRFPAYATSMGRVLLAGLPPQQLDDYLASLCVDRFTHRTVADARALRAVLDTVQEQGYALVDQELEAGLRSLAVPVHDADGVVVAGANVSTHASRVSVEQMITEFLPLLRGAVIDIEQDLALVSGR